MLKELIHFQFFGHPITVFGYGFMLVIAFFACVFAMRWLAAKVGINPEHAVNAVFVALVTGIIGARISDVLENFNQYFLPHRSFFANLFAAIDIHQGGLTYYGGFILATPCCIAYAIWKKIPVLIGMDIVAPVLMIGLGIGRIGCFLNGCCYGERCELPWAVSFPYYSDAYIQQLYQNEIDAPPALTVPSDDPTRMHVLSPAEIAGHPELVQIAASSRALPVQPTEIYSTITAFILAALLIAFLSVRGIPGRVFALMLMLEGFSRYVLEIIRVEPAVYTLHFHNQPYGLSLSMVIGIVCVLAGAIMWIALRKPSHNSSECATS